jgi:hypothetical protein
MLDEKAIIFKVQYLYGKHGRICGGHKREGECALPGEVSWYASLLLMLRSVRMYHEKSAEVIVCARQRMNREGLSPSGARIRSAVSKGGGNASLASDKERCIQRRG